jgi:hypothetical protein
MIAAAKQKLIDPVAAFRLRAEARALLWSIRELDLSEAVDELQACAERDGLLERIGQDHLQELLASAFAPYREAQS